MTLSSKRSLAKAVSNTANYQYHTQPLRLSSSFAILHSSSRDVVFRNNKTSSMFLLRNNNLLRPLISARYASSEGNDNKKGSSDSGEEGPKEGGEDEAKSQAVVLTPGEKVVGATKSAMWLGVLAFAGVCGYYIVMELFPSKMSANTVFNKAFEVVRENPDVKRKFGDSLKAYGRGGGRNEGRRNFIEHTEYTSQDDGSKRTRVRFNIEGQFGAAFVFAEVSKDMPSGEFVYIIVQDKNTGRVTTIVDNRAALKIKHMTAGSDEGSRVFGNLLGGGGGDKK
eukprot:CAMPEP_0185732640 /NCGR_PEP_ID=MMETSP1171-20130828/16954_1 /TAXON_ID=374046 /ORGANISM="Helicotheca tamensis, Strain CCMP826" /LENGTH=280 /DNA_ID=CAMNT_0028402181 /DNA_START=124 /DNA_END=966 /DNA_ORIENTATION=+